MDPPFDHRGKRCGWRFFCVIGNSSGISITQNAPQDAQFADEKIAYAILLARLSSARAHREE